MWVFACVILNWLCLRNALDPERTALFIETAWSSSIFNPQLISTGSASRVHARLILCNAAVKTQGFVSQKTVLCKNRILSNVIRLFPVRCICRFMAMLVMLSLILYSLLLFEVLFLLKLCSKGLGWESNWRRDVRWNKFYWRDVGKRYFGWSGVCSFWQVG